MSCAELSAPGRKFGDVFCRAGFQTCCLADFQIRKRPNKGRSADWKSAIQQVWKPALRHRICARLRLAEEFRHALFFGRLVDFYCQS